MFHPHRRSAGGVQLSCKGKPARPAYDSHYSRYQHIYSAFLDAGVPIMGLRDGSKYPFHFSAPQSVLRDLRQVEAAMDAGLNIGAATHQQSLPDANPLRFWDLDIDGPKHGLDLSPFTYRVRRRGVQDRAHYLARHPDPSATLRASYSGRDYDLCTWNTVMPGSVHQDGTVYELEYLVDGDWVEWDGEPFRIDLLPQVDPEQYRAKENQRGRDPRRLKSKPQMLASHLRKFQPRIQVANQRAVGSVADVAAPPPHTGASRMPAVQAGGHALQRPLRTPVWVSATGSLSTRTKMAKDYLRYYAWRSVEHRNGHSSLMVVVANLRLFHRLDQSTAVEMVKEYFNPRCIDLQGNPCPWFDAEITHKWRQAGKPEAYPTLGVNNPKARAKEARLMLEGEVTEFLERFTTEGGTSNPTDLRLAFIASRGGEVVNPTAFGRAVSRATGVRTASPNGKRVYQGFRLTEAGLGFTNIPSRTLDVA